MDKKGNDDFIPCTKWKRFPVMTFVDYEFTINGQDIEFDERVLPDQLDVKEGDKFTVKIDRFGRVILTRS